MAREHLSVDEIVKSIERDGVFIHQDAEVGKQVDDFAAKGYPIRNTQGDFPVMSIEALDSCKVNVLENNTVSEVLHACFDSCKLDFFKTLRAEPHGVFCLFDPRRPRLSGLIVQLWGTGSRAVFYKGSHRLSCATSPAINGLLTMPHEAIAVSTVERIEADMMSGGLVILDARLGFTIENGRPIVFVFAICEEMRDWARLRGPIGFRENIKEMTSEKIGINVEYLLTWENENVVLQPRGH